MYHAELEIVHYGGGEIKTNILAIPFSSGGKSILRLSPRRPRSLTFGGGLFSEPQFFCAPVDGLIQNLTAYNLFLDKPLTSGQCLRFRVCVAPGGISGFTNTLLMCDFVGDGKCAMMEKTIQNRVIYVAAGNRISINLELLSDNPKDEIGGISPSAGIIFRPLTENLKSINCSPSIIRHVTKKTILHPNRPGYFIYGTNINYEEVINWVAPHDGILGNLFFFVTNFSSSALLGRKDKITSRLVISKPGRGKFVVTKLLAKMNGHDTKHFIAIRRGTRIALQVLWKNNLSPTTILSPTMKVCLKAAYTFTPTG